MVYLLVALIAARSRLDAFRLTTAGALLLGRIFSLWNLPAYAIGMAAACAFDPARRTAVSLPSHDADATARLRVRPLPFCLLRAIGR